MKVHFAVTSLFLGTVITGCLTILAEATENSIRISQKHGEKKNMRAKLRTPLSEDETMDLYEMLLNFAGQKYFESRSKAHMFVAAQITCISDECERDTASKSKEIEVELKKKWQVNQLNEFLAKCFEKSIHDFTGKGKKALPASLDAYSMLLVENTVREPTSVLQTSSKPLIKSQQSNIMRKIKAVKNLLVGTAIPVSTIEESVTEAQAADFLKIIHSEMGERKMENSHETFILTGSVDGQEFDVTLSEETAINLNNFFSSVTQEDIDQKMSEDEHINADSASANTELTVEIFAVGSSVTFFDIVHSVLHSYTSLIRLIHSLV